jgi:hypothetical protein
LKSFRFYHDIDAKNEEAARDQLIEDMETMPLCDMFVEEKESDQFTTEELKKLLNITDNYETLSKIEAAWCGWDGWYCRVEDCGHVVGCDTGDMFDHMKTHTKKEILEAME